MISKEQLIERFKAIIQFETDMKNEYDDFIDILNNQVILDKIKIIRDWEIRHIQLAEELISAVQKHS